MGGQVGLERQLGRQVIARLLAAGGDAGHDAAQIHISQGDGGVLVGRPRDEQVLPVDCWA
jgi:hypothetical protein